MTAAEQKFRGLIMEILLLQAGIVPVLSVMASGMYLKKNGKPSAVELSNNAVLVDMQYFSEDGNPDVDTANKDTAALFAGGAKA